MTERLPLHRRHGSGVGRSPLMLLAGLGALGGFGCVGVIGDGGGSSAGGAGGTGGAGGRSGAGGTGGTGGTGGAAPVTAGPMPLRRLTRTEYESSVRVLLRLDSAATLPSDLSDDIPGSSGFTESADVSESEAARLQSAAEAAALEAKRSLEKLLPCDPGTVGEDLCADQFIRSFGRRAYRRPLAAEEIASIKALYTHGRTKMSLSFSDGITQVITGILQSPKFVYHWEIGPSKPATEGGLVRLGADELASRLSFFLSSAMPDDQLFAAVDDGRFVTTADLDREARRLLSEPRSRRTVVDFHRQWLRLGAGDSDAAGPADAETAAFIGHVLALDGRLSTLFTSPVSFVDRTLASIYGVSGVTGDTLQQATLNPEQRFGILTQVKFLTRTASEAGQSHPVKRGHVIFSQVLCGDLPPPPQNVPPAPKPSAAVSNRERFAVHGESACAVACHGLMDPIGFALESYDGRGKFRTEDAGKPVDATGGIVFPSGATTTVNGARALIDALVASEETARCATRQWLRFAFGRREVDADAASLETAYQAFARSQLDVRELLIAMVKTRSFLYRTPAIGEVL